MSKAVTSITAVTTTAARGASGLRQGRFPAGRSSPSPGFLAVRSTLRTQW